MFNSVAFNVVVGLVFIYLLYSLLATVVSETVATLLRLRANHLRRAIGQMLSPVMADKILSNPEIKRQGAARGQFRPSTLRAESFSRALVDELSGDGMPSVTKIDTVLRLGAQEGRANAADDGQAALGTDTARYLLGLWEEAGSDLQRFRKLSEDWFNRAMEHASEWYKRRIQWVLLLIGFLIAWLFGADTFLIVKKLSYDKQSREQMVALSESYLKGLQSPQDTTFMAVAARLEADLTNAHAVLGLGSCLPARVRVVTDPVTRERSYNPPIDPNCLSDTDRKVYSGTLAFSFADRIGYFFRMGWHHFFGFLITAIAVSLGAPFWFDLLNKVMRLRTSAKWKVPKPQNS